MVPKDDWITNRDDVAGAPRIFASCILIGELVGDIHIEANKSSRSHQGKIRGQFRLALLDHGLDAKPRRRYGAVHDRASGEFSVLYLTVACRKMDLFLVYLEK